ncbi:cell division protein FtsQ/DivIB [Lyticum sinuosum]|uniref:cell division protein FtsQ/DivIB n=1 Tax=Lyticum sinuosum TaxID=1332059 RepID=UPI002ACDD28C|nr:cell division protein FtsQ/DivIB [Lyticum sinuosum]
MNIFKNIYEIDDKKIVLLSDNLYTNDIISEKDIFNCFITENNKKSDIYDFLLEEQKKSFIVKIFNALNISFNKINLLYIDLFLIKQRILEKCPIIDNVIITSSFYPSLKIQLIVKKPEAILYKKINNKEKYYFIDKFGEEIKINKPYLNNLLNNRNYKLPIVLGKNSEKNFFTTLSVLKKCGIDIETIYSMHYILERRWNLYLKDGLKIKLPENNQICRAIKIWELTKDQYIKAKYVDLRLTYLKQPLIYYN